MRRNTIKWRIFKYNLIVIILLIALTTIIFNSAIRLYIKKDIMDQLNKIASHTENTALEKGPDFFPKPKDIYPPPPPPGTQSNDSQDSDMKNIPQNISQNILPDDNELLRFYFMLDRSLREPLSVLNANYILLDNDKNAIVTPAMGYLNTSNELMSKITSEISKTKDLSNETYLDFYLSGTEYIAVVKPVFQKNSFGLGWIVIYSSLQKINQLQWGINLILLVILILSSIVIVIFSSLAAKKISAPFSSLNQHIRAIAERNFGF